jgi:hypothetical protein
MLLQNSLREFFSISETMDSVVMDEIMYQALKWMRTSSDEEKKCYAGIGHNYWGFSIQISSH